MGAWGAYITVGGHHGCWHNDIAFESHLDTWSCFLEYVLSGFHWFSCQVLSIWATLPCNFIAIFLCLCSFLLLTPRNWVEDKDSSSLFQKPATYLCIQSAPTTCLEEGTFSFNFWSIPYIFLRNVGCWQTTSTIHDNKSLWLWAAVKHLQWARLFGFPLYLLLLLILHLNYFQPQLLFRLLFVLGVVGIPKEPWVQTSAYLCNFKHCLTSVVTCVQMPGPT